MSMGRTNLLQRFPNIPPPSIVGPIIALLREIGLKLIRVCDKNLIGSYRRFTSFMVAIITFCLSISKNNGSFPTE